MRTYSFLLLAALGSVLVPSSALACGGLFCSNASQPVNQKAERGSSAGEGGR